MKHTGYQGVVKDAYQRVCLRMSAHEFLQPDMWKKTYDLVSAYMLRHILLEIDLKDTSLDYQQLDVQCTALKDLTLSEEKVVFTCEVANYERDNVVIRAVMAHIKPTVVLLKRCATRTKTLTMIKYLAQDTDNLAEEFHKEGEASADENNNDINTEEPTLGARKKMILKAPVVPVALGVSCLEELEKQYALDAHRGVIRAMCLGPVCYPNLFTCTIDLLHTRECMHQCHSSICVPFCLFLSLSPRHSVYFLTDCLFVAFSTILFVLGNAYVTIDSFEADHMRGLGKFVKKYNRPAPAIVTKALLELGAIVCIDRTLIDDEIFYNSILRLAHPFTHMQVCYMKKHRVSVLFMFLDFYS